MKLPAALAGCAALVAGCSPAPAPAVIGRRTDPSTVPGRPAEEADPGVDVGPTPAPAGAASSSTVDVDPPASAVEPSTEAPTTTVTVTLPHATTTTTLVLPERSDAEQGDVEWLVRQTFPEDPDRAAAIAFNESRFQPGAQNGQYVGVMQIGTATHAALIASMGYTTADMYHAIPNLAVARALFNEAGWSPWA